jgi:hypothetical protein
VTSVPANAAPLRGSIAAPTTGGDLRLPPGLGAGFQTLLLLLLASGLPPVIPVPAPAAASGETPGDEVKAGDQERARQPEAPAAAAAPAPSVVEPVAAAAAAVAAEQVQAAAPAGTTTTPTPPPAAKAAVTSSLPSALRPSPPATEHAAVAPPSAPPAPPAPPGASAPPVLALAPGVELAPPPLDATPSAAVAEAEPPRVGDAAPAPPPAAVPAPAAAPTRPAPAHAPVVTPLAVPVTSAVAALPGQPRRASADDGDRPTSAGPSHAETAPPPPLPDAAPRPAAGPPGPSSLPAPGGAPAPRAPAAPPATAAPEPARPRELDDLVRTAQVRAPAARDGGEMRLDVAPEGLGRVQVHVVVRDDAVHAVLYAQHDDARDALAAQRPALEAALGRSQLRLEGFTVGLGQPQQEPAHERSPGPPRRGEPAPLAPAPVPQPAAAEPLVVGRHNLSLRA